MSSPPRVFMLTLAHHQETELHAQHGYDIDGCNPVVKALTLVHQENTKPAIAGFVFSAIRVIRILQAYYSRPYSQPPKSKAP